MNWAMGLLFKSLYIVVAMSLGWDAADEDNMGPHARTSEISSSSALGLGKQT